ncbi:TPA: exodeoxyribonuclease VIII [Klebsiella pneumoniae]|nr:exodeoxyribonuclease VIII [Klebsiella pneumoniae]
MKDEDDLIMFTLYAVERELASEDDLPFKTTLTFMAANIRQARAKATMKFVEQYPDFDDEKFDLVVYETASESVIVHATIDEWDSEIMAGYGWDVENKCPVNITPEHSSDYVDFSKLPAPIQNAVLVKFSSTEITKDQLADAIDLVQEDTGTFAGHIVEALNKTPQIDSMYAERKMEAISYAVKNCPSTKKWPDIKAVLMKWLKEHEAEHKEEQRESGNKITVTKGTVTAYNGRQYDHTIRTLNKEIAYALWAGDVDAGKLEPSISKWADGIIKDDREDWKRWSAVITTQPEILSYDRPTIFNLVRNAPSKDTYHFPDTLKRYVVGYLAEHGVKEGAGNDQKQQAPVDDDEPVANEDPQSDDVEPEQSAGQPEALPERQGPFYFLLADGEKVGRANKLPGLEKALADGATEISQAEYQARKNGTFKEEPQDPQPEPKSAQPEQPKAQEEQPDAPPAVSADSTQPDGFTLRADELENELGDSVNLALWKSVMRTNPRYTKDMSDLGFGGTSINAEYMLMRATETFGPAGHGWGWKIIEDKMIEGAPLTEKIFEGNKFVGKRILRDADGSLLFELNHYLRIELWYIKDGKRGSVENFGSTPYRQSTKNGIYCDSEVHKKSLTDAIKKCLSTLGFSADVWLGLYDDAAYKAESVLEFGIKDASDKADDSTRIREELDEKFKQNVETMRKAVSQNEISKIASSLTRTVGIHLKTAKDINDLEYVKYLEGRLRRLEEVKVECLNKLQENAE